MDNVSLQRPNFSHRNQSFEGYQELEYEALPVGPKLGLKNCYIEGNLYAKKEGLIHSQNVDSQEILPMI